MSDGPDRFPGAGPDPHCWPRPATAPVGPHASDAGLWSAPSGSPAAPGTGCSPRRPPERLGQRLRRRPVLLRTAGQADAMLVAHQPPCWSPIDGAAPRPGSGGPYRWPPRTSRWSARKGPTPTCSTRATSGSPVGRGPPGPRPGHRCPCSPPSAEPGGAGRPDPLDLGTRTDPRHMGGPGVRSGGCTEIASPSAAQRTGCERILKPAAGVRSAPAGKDRGIGQ